MSEATLFILGGIVIALIITASIFIVKLLDWSNANKTIKILCSTIFIGISLIIIAIILITTIWPSLINTTDNMTVQNAVALAKEPISSKSNSTGQGEWLGSAGILITLIGISMGLIYQGKTMVTGNDPLRKMPATETLAKEITFTGEIIASLSILWWVGTMWNGWLGLFSAIIVAVIYHYIIKHL